MNKFFALSLLMLSSAVAYGMHEEKSVGENPRCCTFDQSKVGHNACELRKYDVDVDVESHSKLGL